MVVKTQISFLNTDRNDELIGHTRGVIDGLTNNPNFATPVPALADVSTALAAFVTAVAAAVNGGTEQTAAKKARRAELVALMRQLASYVTITSNGDMEKLLSSGFPRQKPVRTPVGTLPAPDAPKLRYTDKSGELDATVAPVYGAATYNWRVALATEPDTFVQTAQTTGGRCLFEGLTPGKIYTVQANAVGTAGPSDWSDNADLMVV